jgi:hypothetical protein
MPETQMRKLVEMMGSHTLPSCFGVYLPSIQIKKKEFKNLKKGDILPLDSKELRVDILDDDQLLAQGIYGIYKDNRSILIEDFSPMRSKKSNTKKYHTIKIRLGCIDRIKFDDVKVVRLRNDEKYDALLYKDQKLFAKTIFVQIDSEVALRIEEMTR